MACFLKLNKKIELIVVHVNEGQRKYEEQQRILSIQSSIDMEIELLAPARVLLREGPITMKVTDTDRPTEHHIFLFNDLILFTKKNPLKMFSQKEFTFVGKIAMESTRLVLWADDATQPTHKIFQLISGDKTYTIGFQAKAETESWFDSIKKAIKEFQQKKLQGSKMKSSPARDSSGS